MYRGSTRDDQRGDRHYGCDRGRSYNHQQRGGGGRVDYNSGNGRFEGQREDGGINGYNGGGGGGFRGGGGRGYRGGQAREGGYGDGGGRDGGRGGGYRGGGGYGGAGGSEGYGGGGYGGGRGGRGRGEYINGRRDGWDSRKRPHEGDFDAENGERAPKSKFVQVTQPIVPYPIEVDIIGVINGQEAKMDFKSASGASIASIKEVHIYGEVEHCLPIGNELMLFLCNKVGPFFENGVQICGNETLSSASQNLISIASGLFSKSQFVQLGNNQLALLKVPLIECMAEIWVDVSPECGILDVNGYWFKALFEWLWGKKARRRNSNPKRLLINLPNEQFAIHWVEQFNKDPGDMPYQVLIRCGQYRLFPRELKRGRSTFSLQLTGQNEYLFSKNPIDEPRPGNLTFASARALPKVLFANKPKPNA